MNVALCFIPKELEQARRWFDFCAELGGVSKHDLHVMPFKGMPFDFASIKGWRSVTHIEDWYGRMSDWSGDGTQRDAAGPNESWRGIARWFAEKKRGPWCFVEPDCIPTTPDWLDRIEAEYRTSGKRYMGALVNLPPIPPHMTGNGVYPENVGDTSTKFMLARHAVIEGKEYEVAFDVAGADDSLADFHATSLIQHRFRAAPITTREEFETLVDKNAVLYHSDKTGSVCQFIREKLSGRTGTQREPAAAVAVMSAHATPTGKPKVYTFASPPPADPRLIAEQKKLCASWSILWAGAGFDPVILTDEDAEKHPRYEEWMRWLLNKPTVNPPSYEEATWKRWCAFAAADAKLWTDYDVIPNGFKFADACFGSVSLPTLLCRDVPCAVIGNADSFERAIGEFIRCEPIAENGQPHLSDMHACKKLNFPSVDLCREYGTPGFEQAKLIHFSHATRHGKLRSELIEEWLAGKVNQALLDTAATMGDVKFPLRTMPATRESYMEHVMKHGESSLCTPEQIAAGRIDVPLEQAPDPPTTRASKVRFHVDALAELSDTPSRKILVVKALRKKGVIGKPKKRKRRKWKMLG